jgi:thioesterase domain-containing protein/acyl carrier protein
MEVAEAGPGLLHAAGSARDRGAIDDAGPRSMVEFFLRDLWEDVLHVRPIGIRDDFFTLGGTSVIAAEIGAGIERRIGVRLPLEELGESATIERLAQAVERYQRIEMIGTLFPFRTVGDERPLFFFNVMEVLPGLGLADMLRHIDPAYPVYLARSALLTPRGSTYRIEDLVAEHVRAVRRVQPRGPYRMAALCSGAYVALGVADALRAAGEEVDLLAFVHAGHPRALANGRQRRLAAVLTRATRLGVLSPRAAAECYITLRTIRVLGSRSARGAQGRLGSARRARPVGLRSARDAFLALRERVRIMHMALRDWCAVSYRLPHWPGSLLCVVAEDPQGDPRDTEAGWEHVAARLDVHRVPWHYRDFFLHLPALVEVLNGYLREADRRPHGAEVCAGPEHEVHAWTTEERMT